MVPSDSGFTSGLFIHYFITHLQAEESACYKTKMAAIAVGKRKKLKLLFLDTVIM